MLSAFFVVAMRLAGLPLAVASAAADLPPPNVEACANSGSSDDTDDDAAPLNLDGSDDDEAAHGSAPLMTPPNARVQVPELEAAAGTGCGALAEQRALASHVRNLERPPRA